MTASTARPISSASFARLRLAKPEDHGQIAALEARYGLDAKSHEEWTHLYANNPVCIDNPGSWPIGWVLETPGGEIVGHLGNIPLNYELRGRILRAVSARAWVVDRPYRGQSMSLLNAWLRQKDTDLFLCTTAGPVTSRILRLLRLSRVPAGRWDASAFWITNYAGFGASWISLKLPKAPRIAGFAAGAVLCVADQFRPKPAAPSKQPEITFCNSFDERFDEFWQKLRIERRDSLLAVRTREVLNWHFKFPLLRDKLWIATVVNVTGIVAYAMFLRQDQPRIGLKRVWMVDFQSLRPHDQLLAPLLLRALERCRKERIHMLEQIGASTETKILQELRPRVRTLGSWLYFYKAANESLSPTLNSSGVWDPSLFDGDATL